MSSVMKIIGGDTSSSEQHKFLDSIGLSNLLNKIKSYITNKTKIKFYVGDTDITEPSSNVCISGNLNIALNQPYTISNILGSTDVETTYLTLLNDNRGNMYNYVCTSIDHSAITIQPTLSTTLTDLNSIDVSKITSYNISTTYLELPYTQSYIKIGKPYEEKTQIMKAPASTITSSQTVIDGVTYILKYTGDNTITLGDNEINFNPQLYLRKDSNTTKIDGISIITDTLYSHEDKTTYMTSSYISSTSIGTNSIYASEEDGTLSISSEGNGTVSINANDIELNADNEISTSNINTSYIYYKGFTDQDALAWCKNNISTDDYVIHSAHVIGFSNIGIVTVQLCVTGNGIETLYIYDSSANRMGFLPSTFISGFGLCNVGTFTFGVTSTGPNNYYLGNYDEA